MAATLQEVAMQVGVSSQAPPLVSGLPQARAAGLAQSPRETQPLVQQVPPSLLAGHV